MAGGVPEVMLHLRRMGLLERRRADGDGREAGRRCSTGGRRATGAREARARLREVRRRRSRPRDHERRRRARGRADQHGGVSGRQHRARGLGGEGDGDRSVGRRRRSASTATAARRACSRPRPTPSRRSKGRAGRPVPVKADDVVVLIGAGPLGTGMEETYQLTSALKFIPWGKTRAGRHRRALLGRVDRRLHRPRRARGAGRRADRQARRRRHHRDRRSIATRSTGRVDLVAADGRDLDADDGGAAAGDAPARTRASRPHAKLPDDTRLWAALQQASGGTWGGCVYDVDRIVEVIGAGRRSARRGRKK